MFDIIIGVLLIWVVIMLTWTYLTHSIILIISITAMFIILYSLMKVVIPAKKKKRSFLRSTTKDYRIVDDECITYDDVDSVDNQYEIDTMLKHFYKHNPNYKIYDAISDEYILKKSIIKQNSIHRYRQGLVIDEIYLQIVVDNNEKRIKIIYVEEDDTELIVGILNNKDVEEIIATYDKIKYTAIKIEGGEEKYSYHNKNGILAIKKENNPYTIKLIICYL